jgi:hypothetical protein
MSEPTKDPRVFISPILNEKMRLPYDIQLFAAKHRGRPKVYQVEPPNAYKNWPTGKVPLGYSKELIDGIPIYFKDGRPVSRVLVPIIELNRLDHYEEPA